MAAEFREPQCPDVAEDYLDEIQRNRIMVQELG